MSGVFLCRFVPYRFETGVREWEWPFLFCWLARQCALENCLSLLSKARVTAMLGFYVGAGDLNSAPCAYIAFLSPEPFPQFLFKSTFKCLNSQIVV